MAVSDSHPLHIVIVGHVDHGKSTLIGRLLHDTKGLPEGRYAELKKMTARRGRAGIEWSFALDAFQAERDQNITIDTTQIRFKTAKREYVMIDAPGHRTLLKNMMTGAAAADSAILVIDASEGVREQTRRHAFLLNMMGLRQVVVVINKMDLIGYDSGRFNNLKADITGYLSSLGIVPAHVIPVSAQHGHMISIRNPELGWYQGPLLTESLDSLSLSIRSLDNPLRLPVQDIYKFDHERMIVGRIESGILKLGDKLLFSPSLESATVTSISTWPADGKKLQANAGESIGITLDNSLLIKRGDIGSHEAHKPVLSSVFSARIFWLSQRPLKIGDSYRIRYLTHEAHVTVQAVRNMIDPQTLAVEKIPSQLEQGMAADIIVRARTAIPLDSYEENNLMGRITVCHGHDIAGGGTISREELAASRNSEKPFPANIHAVSHLLSADERALKAGHHGGIFWLTGLSGSGKSTLAMNLEQQLFNRGYRVYVLDGDNIRGGLCADLGFTPEDRSENIRRVGEVAMLMADAGLIVITAFISPFRDDRNRIKDSASDRFHEIYLSASMAICEKRDPKGLYRKARSGGLKDFTGIDSPYEPPDNPDLVLDTERHDINECLAQLLSYIEINVALNNQQENKRAF